MFVASDEATSGSLIAKADRISPSSSGRSQRSYWAGVAKSLSSSMLPVSGALQLKTSADHGTRPISSAIGAYSTCDSPVPGSSSPSVGRKKFQRFSAFAYSFSSARNGGGQSP